MESLLSSGHAITVYVDDNNNHNNIDNKTSDAVMIHHLLKNIVSLTLQD